MSLYADVWPVLCENPYGGSAYYTITWHCEDEARVCLMVEVFFDLDDYRLWESFPVLLTHKEAAVWSYVRNTVQEYVDDLIHQTYRRVSGPSEVEGAPNNGDED